MDLREVGYDDRDWINLAQDRDRWRAYNMGGVIVGGRRTKCIRFADDMVLLAEEDTKGYANGGKMSEFHFLHPNGYNFDGNEKETKKRNIITKFEDYCNIFNNNGTIIKLVTDCPVYDWKMKIQSVFKSSGWQFKLKFCKRIKINEQKMEL
ncbi:hypothetical protein ANN_03300 [Periplaneta americana]|uniref:Uncharacterized protein n=1 Tax=Periplaneta americana TaxID=6978 RepID=A0ABQ8TYK8_PERAM|nr:hypothetical protein ANN_03300 [Periplaneta americana]